MGDHHTSGENILFVSCKGSLLPCSENNTFSKNTCAECRFLQSAGINRFNSKVNFTSVLIEDFSSRDKAVEVFKQANKDGIFNYDTVDEIKRIEYKNVQIGYGALSSYVSWTRNQSPLIDLKFRKYFDELLIQQIFLKDSIDNIINEFEVEKITLFNGRRADVRPVFDTARHFNIELRNLENFRFTNDDFSSSRMEVFPNRLPHDPVFHKNRMEKCWHNSTLNEDEKVRIGSSFYDSKKSLKPVRQNKSYISHQKEGELPDGFDPSMRNFAIFNSSDDEFVALGREFDEASLFASQIDSIKKICEICGKDESIQIYLKVHPNLSDVSYKYHKDLYFLPDNYSNIKVIPSTSEVSTYTLMENCEKVIVHTSSVALEANYIGVPVIMFGLFYSELDVGYFPKNLTEFEDQLLNKLKPKKSLNSIKYGFYMINMDSYSEKIRYQPKKFVIPGLVNFHIFRHLKFWKSSLIFRTIYEILKLTRFRKNGNVVVPLK